MAHNVQGQVIGFASGGAERGELDKYDGELYAIYLLKDTQRKDIGRKLINSIARYLQHKGYKNMAVWVLADNPPHGFYKALGGTFVKEKTIKMGDDDLLEVAYGWELATFTSE